MILYSNTYVYKHDTYLKGGPKGYVCKRFPYWTFKIKKNTLKILIVGAKWYIMNDI